mgnify:FL=1
MFKSIFFRLVAFIFRPMDAWDALSHKKVTGNEAFLAHFLYPIIGLIALAAFAGVLFAGREFDFVIALKSSIKAIATSLGGFFLASYLMNELWGAWMKRERNMKLMQLFVGYASSLLFVLQIILSFFPDLAFLWIPALYTIYIVWAGAVNYLKVDGEVQMKFTGIASLIIIGAPAAISLLLFMLMPGLRF